MISAMDAASQAIEPTFLTQAVTQGVKLRIGHMNRTEQEGVVREIGRYEINIEEHGSIITIPKQDISYLTAPSPLVSPPAPGPAAQQAGPAAKPNIQQEFLDKAIRERHPLAIFLVNGQRIKGILEAYDSFTLLLREGSRQHLYYKHAITTINR